MKLLKKWITLLPFAVLFLLSAAAFFSEDRERSAEEKRHLAMRPELSATAVFDGSYMRELESYLTDQFPFRDFFRGICAETETTVLGKSDTGGYYRSGDGIYKMDAGLNEKNVIRAAENFSEIAAAYFPDSAVYSAVIPDKSRYLHGTSKNPRLDCEAVEALMEEHMDGAVFIPLSGALTLSDYYKTDPHWRQERIGGIAELLLSSMKAGPFGELPGQKRKVQTVSEAYVGSYAGASAFFTEPEKLCCITDEVIDAARVYDYEKKEEVEVYAWEKLEEGSDFYDFYLWGPRALLKMENPFAAAEQKSLILFRDSFGSSIAPLLLSGYREIILVDLRYVKAEYALELLSDKKGADILFLYSAAVLNHSDSMRF